MGSRLKTSDSKSKQIKKENIEFRSLQQPSREEHSKIQEAPQEYRFLGDAANLLKTLLRLMDPRSTGASSSDA